jgi:hypothetical protein
MERYRAKTEAIKSMQLAVTRVLLALHEQFKLAVMLEDAITCGGSGGRAGTGRVATHGCCWVGAIATSVKLLSWRCEQGSSIGFARVAEHQGLRSGRVFKEQYRSSFSRALSTSARN